jgi:hypothetical protein
MEISSMFIWMKDQTLDLHSNSWFSSKDESPLGEDMDMWLGIDDIDPLNSDLAVPGKDPI